MTAETAPLIRIAGRVYELPSKPPSKPEKKIRYRQDTYVNEWVEVDGITYEVILNEERSSGTRLSRNPVTARSKILDAMTYYGGEWHSRDLREIAGVSFPRFYEVMRDLMGEGVVTKIEPGWYRLVEGGR